MPVPAVGGGTIIYTKKLTMDDTSVLTLRYVELECDTADGLDGIEKYLPKDGKFEFKMPDGSVTVEAIFVKKAAEEEKPVSKVGLRTQQCCMGSQCRYCFRQGQ